MLLRQADTQEDQEASPTGPTSQLIGHDCVMPKVVHGRLEPGAVAREEERCGRRPPGGNIRSPNPTTNPGCRWSR